jgi:hypothetical protein
MFVFSDRRPSVTLPDGLKVIYAGSSRGVLDPSKQLYRHSRPPQEQHRLQQWWQNNRSSLPGWLVSRLPAWDVHGDNYPDWRDSHELELQFLVVGDLRPHQWDIFVADENGWESRVHNYPFADDGRYERGASQHSGWVRLGGAYPRHCKTIGVRFHLDKEHQPGLTVEQRSAKFTELTIPNPFYEGPVSGTAKGEPLPITKPFRGGTMTLEKVQRDAAVGEDYGYLWLTLRASDGTTNAIDVQTVEITDSSGQQIPDDSGWGKPGKNGCFMYGIGGAPWSDDPTWRLHFRFCRTSHWSCVKEEEVFRFENLPVPTGDPVELNREVTHNGVTLRLGTLSAVYVDAVKHDVADFTVSGWKDDDPQHHLVFIHEARDDQGRTERAFPNGGKSRLVHGPTARYPDHSSYQVRLPPGAKSWSVSLVPETVTEVDFTFQAPQP